jgi:hypothetical protein
VFFLVGELIVGTRTRLLSAPWCPVRTALNQEKTAAKIVAGDPTRLHRVDELSPAVLCARLHRIADSVAARTTSRETGGSANAGGTTMARRAARDATRKKSCRDQAQLIERKLCAGALFNIPASKGPV